VLSKTSFLLATVFGRAAIDDSVDEQQRFSVRRFFVGGLQNEVFIARLRLTVNMGGYLLERTQLPTPFIGSLLGRGTRTRLPAPRATDGSDGDRRASREKKKRRPMSEETKAKIAAAQRGRRQSAETREKISATMKNRSLSLTHRLRISDASMGRSHSPETRMRIGETVHETKKRLKKQRLGDRAARAAVAATADLQAGSMGDKGLILDEIELEKAVLEVTRLRDELTSWMDTYEAETGSKPDLTETSETMPTIYGRFVRYVTLRDLVRRSSLQMGTTPVVWT